MSRLATHEPIARTGSLLTRVGAIILVTTVTVGVLAVAILAQMVAEQRRNDLLRRAELVAATQADALSGPVWELDARAAQTMIDALKARDPAIRAIGVYEASRTSPLAETANPQPADKAERITIERPVVLHAREGRSEIVGSLRLVISTAEVVSATVQELLPLVGLLVLSLLAAIAVLSVSLTSIVLKPLSRLTQLSRALTRGDYRARLQTDRTDEIGVLTDSLNRMAETIQDHTRTLETRVQERTEALAATNRAIMDSINYAQLIQSSILPSTEALSSGLAEHFVLWRPRDVVSGDFYICRDVADGFVVGVADCTGHGVPGAFMTMTASAILNNALDQMRTPDPAAILTAVDQKVRATLHQEGMARTMAERFDNGLDLALCYVRPAERRLIFSSARIPLLFTGPDGVGELRGDRYSLGYRRAPGMAEPVFSNQSVALRPGMTFYLGTDGLSDQGGGERGRSLGRRRLREEIARAAGQPLDFQKMALEHLLNDYQADRPQRDDITLLGFRVRPSEAGRQPADRDGSRRAA